MFREWSMFRRLFVSYMLIVLIPVFALFGFLYQHSVVKLRSEVEAFSISSMSRVKDTMDTRIREWKSISSLISLNPKLSPYNMTNENFRTLEGLDELAKYKAGNAFINDILLWYRNDDARLYTPTGTVSMPVLLERSYGFREEERLRFAEEVRSLAVPVMRSFPASGKMSYMVPIPVFGGTQHGTVVFMFDGETVKRMISEGRTGLQGAILILDVNRNEIMAVDNNGMLVDQGLLAHLKEHIRPGIHVTDYNKESLSMISVVSEETGWTYATVIPTRQFQAPVTSQVGFVVVITALLLLICSAIAITMTFGNYRPIRRLNAFVAQHRLSSDRWNNGNELDNIGRAIGQALALNRSLSVQLDTHRLLLRHEVLIRLLKGESVHPEESLERLKSSGLQLPGPYYAVLLVHYSPGEEELAKRNGQLLDYVAEEHADGGGAIAVEPGPDSSIAIVVCIENDGDDAGPLRLAKRILAWYGDPAGNKVTVGIGSIVGDLFRINRSYIEALASAHHRSIVRDRPIIRFADVVASSQLYWLSAEDEMHWLHSLKQGDGALAAEALRKILDGIERRNLSEKLVRFTCNKLADLAIQAAQQETRELDASRKELPPPLGEAMMNVIYYTTLAEFRLHMQELIDRICDYVGSIRRRKDEGAIAQVIRYMEENFADPNLSLDSVAERFGYSNYYWSRFFKEKIGCHFTDYLWKLRVQEAKRQFLATDKTLKDIIAEVGYLDLSSFSRRFKGEEGITPGQYRKLYAGTNGT